MSEITNNLDNQFLYNESRKIPKSNRKIINSVEYTFEKNMKLSILFKRGNTCFVIEEWIITFKHIDLTKEKTLRKGYLYKKLTSLIRSIITLTRILPVYSLSSKSEFDYFFEFKINSNLSINTDSYKSIKFDRVSDKIGNIILECNYLSKLEIFRLEDIMVL